MVWCSTLLDPLPRENTTRLKLFIGKCKDALSNIKRTQYSNKNPISKIWLSLLNQKYFLLSQTLLIRFSVSLIKHLHYTKYFHRFSNTFSFSYLLATFSIWINLVIGEPFQKLNHEKLTIYASIMRNYENYPKYENYKK